jgi:hypothetical protein
MSRANPLRQCRRPTVKSWVGGLLVLLLLVAEAFAVTHSYDSAAHANGQPCAVCVSAASFGAGGISKPLQVDIVVATPVVVVAVLAVLFTVVPTRRYARGPPVVSFTR